MVVLRFLLIVFNVAVVTFLIYRMLAGCTISRWNRSKKILIIAEECLLLLAPLECSLEFLRQHLSTFSFIR